MSDTITRTNAVLVTLVLVLVGLGISGERRLRDAAAVDCAALLERESRVMLYELLIDYHETAGRADLAKAYRQQQVAVGKAVQVGLDASC